MAKQRRKSCFPLLFAQSHLCFPERPAFYRKGLACFAVLFVTLSLSLTHTHSHKLSLTYTHTHSLLSHTLILCIIRNKINIDQYVQNTLIFHSFRLTSSSPQLINKHSFIHFKSILTCLPDLPSTPTSPNNVKEVPFCLINYARKKISKNKNLF